MAKVLVELGERSYPIEIGSGGLEEIGEALGALGLGNRMALVTDECVGPLWGDVVARALSDAGFRVSTIRIPAGEEHKNLAWVGYVYDRLVDAGLDRGCAIAAVGGGVVGDLAGFCAATWLRGVPYVQVPTTLLAQVDSSVGGKTGIDHPAGKNLIGAFYQPRLVWIDVRTLRTLPAEEFRAGLAEVVKYGVILDPDLFALLERDLDRILNRDEALLVEVVRRCCALKAMVVARDERESGFRSVLNFGHTLGHAIEMVTDYRRYRHGEAVAMGMVYAARLSALRGYGDGGLAERLGTLLHRAGLPTEVPEDMTPQELAAAIARDKKACGDRVRFVGVEVLGRTRFELLTPAEIVRLVPLEARAAAG